MVAVGTANELRTNPRSLTGQYLSGTLTLTSGRKPAPWIHSIIVEGATENNLKNITVAFPLQVICAVSGVSGSGKSTLVKKILYPALRKIKGEPGDRPGAHRRLQGNLDQISQLEWIDQNPIGRSSRSNPVTYVKAYDEIRELMSAQPLSRLRGYLPRHFSFNVDGGRCDTCKGEGEQVVEMQFLADIHMPCEQCRGRKFKEEVLEVTYQGKNIHDILCMSVDEALAFFGIDTKPGAAISQLLQPLAQVGLGYVQLGQSSSTLSGGEAQRVKLASFLGRGRSQGKIMFLFDEPTTGLHFHDIRKLLDSFRALVDMGHTVLVIEHNVDVLRQADWIIDLGPEAGEGGGSLVFCGTPAELRKSKKGHTSRYL